MGATREELWTRFLTLLKESPSNRSKARSPQKVGVSEGGSRGSSTDPGEGGGETRQIKGRVMGWGEKIKRSRLEERGFRESGD